MEWAPGNSATDRTRTVGTALEGERTPSCSAAEALRPSGALELQRLPVLRHCEAGQGAAAGGPRSAPAAPQSPLPLREKQRAPCRPHHVCRGTRGNRAAAAAKLQPRKDRALRSQSQQHVPRAEQPGLSGWSGNGSLARLSQRELPRHWHCPEAQQLPPEELPGLCGAPRGTESC